MDCRTAIFKLTSHRVAQIHESLTERCSLILYAYRKFCAAAAAPSQVCSAYISALGSLTEQQQLILPESFRTLPMYVLAMMKTKPLKGAYQTQCQHLI